MLTKQNWGNISIMLGRMHNEDLEGDIFRCWTALRKTCKKQGSHKVRVIEVINELGQILEHENGDEPEGYDEEAKVASFIASLFLTHRGFALISQEDVPYGAIMLEDLWPEIDDFEEVNNRIEEKRILQSESKELEDTGSVQFAKKRAEKLRIKEEKERAARELEVDANDKEKLESHEWLVE